MDTDQENKPSVPTPSEGVKTGYGFGTFKGVFTPSILTILGVIMYLRFGWVLGNVGLFATLLIVTIAVGIVFLTALAISELATNMKVGGGGAYYIISRSLGLEAGAAIGLPLFFAQALGISFYIVGFAESVADIAPMFSVQMIGLATLFVLSILVFVSADLALKMQFIILSLISISLFSFFLGESAPRLVDPNINIITPSKLPFWAVFAVFFPAVTGIEAGLSMSGDLKKPEKSLPLGTFLAVGVGYLVYLLIPLYLNALKIDEHVLLTNSMIMRDVARWGKLIYCGLWGAALSSALGALLGAPRTLQALAKDGVIPKFIGRGYGTKNDPHIATVIAFIVAVLGILLGNLNIIAPILSMFFLTSYGLLNLSAAFGGLMNNPSWRPTFRVHWMFPMAGAISCVMVMLMINAGATFVALTLSAGVYYIMQKRQLNAYWGDMRYGVLMYIIRSALHKITKLDVHEQTWRPNILVLSGSPNTRWHLIALADALSQGKGFLTVAAVVPHDMGDEQRIKDLQSSIAKYLDDRRVPALVKITTSDDVMSGARGLVQDYGFGPLHPNTVMLGDANNHQDDGYINYASLLLAIRAKHKNLVIVREAEEIPKTQNNLRIDLWWRRVGENAGLMFALAYLLKNSPEWEGSTLHIKTIVTSIDQKQDQFDEMQTFIEGTNIGAEIDVLVADNKKPFDMIKEHSKEANIVFMGLRSPEENETAEEYSLYYKNTLENTEDLPPTAMVLSSEKVDFNRIFHIKDIR